MLVEFSVSNYRSIREKQTLSFVADSSNDSQQTQPFATNFKGIFLLPSIVIYGPNASGKSNLIEAMGVMRDIIINSAKWQEKDLILGIKPHELSKNEATEFEIIFIDNHVRYQYGFAATKTRIVEEWLFVSTSSRSQRWLERNEQGWYLNSAKIKGNRELWRESTRTNALFLSTAAQLNSEQFKGIFTWFYENLQGGKSKDYANTKGISTMQLYLSQDKYKSDILNFLNKADFCISEIELSSEPLNEHFLLNQLRFNEAKEHQIYAESIANKIFSPILKTLSADGLSEMPVVKFTHKTINEDSFILELDDESDGTQRFFALSGIWLNALKKGLVLRIDELNDTLHPFLLRHLISLFQNREINKNEAQLIFTTHDTSVLSQTIFRRDQIWFIEKDKNQMSQLSRLSDFKPRKGESLQKNYLQGRYGALPYIGHFFLD